MAVNSTTRATSFLAGLESVAFYVYDCAVRENLYLRRESSDDSRDLEKHISGLYSIVLQFLAQAKVFFDGGTGSK